MQALKNKLQGKSKRSLYKSTDYKSETVSTPNITTSAPAVDDLSTSDHFDEITSIPIPPPMPSSDFWQLGSASDYSPYFLEEHFPKSSRKTVEILPVQHIEKAAVVHEDVRLERVEEIQPVFQVEREKTEIHQITQPIIAHEVKEVSIAQITLPTEILPTIETVGEVAPSLKEESDVIIEAPLRQVVEKTPIIKDTEKWRIIEEVQPIIYRETIVPHVIRVNRSMKEVIVEQPVFVQTTMKYREMESWEKEKYAKFLSMSTPRTDLASKEIIIKSKGLDSSSHVVSEIMTSTNTTISDSSINSTGLSLTSAPLILNKTHLEAKGAKGVAIVHDSITAEITSLRPTKAI